LAPAHQAETRPDLVAELDLDLEHVEWQLAIAAHVAAHDVGDDLFVRRTEAELAVVAVLDAQQLLAVLLPAAGLLPQLGRLHRRHVELDAVGLGELAADDLLQLLQAAPAEGEVAVD